MTDKSIFITGAAGGMGKPTVELLVKNGWHVFAADNSSQALKYYDNSSNVTPVLLDVADRSSIEAAYIKVSSSVNSLQGIVNFAGILRVGSISEMNEEKLALILNINVMGSFRVNQIFLNLLEASTSTKRIINISSETGPQSGGPFNGAYAMSKHAIEAYSDSLRRELMFLDIPVIKIQPGPFKTDMVSSIEKNFNDAINETTRFKKQLNTVKDLALNEQKKAHSPQLIADTILKALNSKKPKAAYPVKVDLSRTLLDFFPAAFADCLLKKIIGK